MCQDFTDNCTKPERMYQGIMSNCTKPLAVGYQDSFLHAFSSADFFHMAVGIEKPSMPCGRTSHGNTWGDKRRTVLPLLLPLLLLPVRAATTHTYPERTPPLQRPTSKHIPHPPFLHPENIQQPRHMFQITSMIVDKRALSIITSNALLIVAEDHVWEEDSMV